MVDPVDAFEPKTIEDPGNSLALTLVVPCYNEEKRLDRRAFYEALETYDWLRLLFVNDGSRDNTLNVLSEMREHRPDCIEFIDLAQNAGKAEAVRQGLLTAIEQDARYTGYWDADLSTGLAELGPMAADLARVPTNLAVFGSRVKRLGARIDRRPARHLIGRIFATLASWVLGVPVYDTQCGAKLFRVTTSFEEVISKPFDTKWIFDVEILARMLARIDPSSTSERDSPIREYPLQDWKDVAGSQLKPSDFVAAAFDLIGVWRRTKKRS